MPFGGGQLPNPHLRDGIVMSYDRREGVADAGSLLQGHQHRCGPCRANGRGEALDLILPRRVLRKTGFHFFARRSRKDATLANWEALCDTRGGKDDITPRWQG